MKAASALAAEHVEHVTAGATLIEEERRSLRNRQPVVGREIAGLPITDPARHSVTDDARVIAAGNWRKSLLVTS